METILQDLVVALLVPVCSGYAAWKLMPAAARRGLAGAALARSAGWPAVWRARLERLASGSAGGCGCDGCDHKVDASAARTPNRAATQTPAPQPIVFHRRTPGR